MLQLPIVLLQNGSHYRTFSLNGHASGAQQVKRHSVSPEQTPPRQLRSFNWASRHPLRKGGALIESALPVQIALA